VSLSELFIHRPIMTTLVMAAILVFGIFAYQLLPVSDLPNVDFPTILVSASLPGASPDTMASSVATPMEKQFSTIAGIDSMTSTNSLGQTSITIQFNLNRSLMALPWTSRRRSPPLEANCLRRCRRLRLSRK